MATVDRFPHRLLSRLLASAATGLTLVAGHAQADERYGFGSTPTPGQIASWNIEVAPDGRNLPAGSSSIAFGKEVYDAKCAACHGSNGEGGIGDRLVGGAGTLATATPIKTVGSYWPYATTLFDYIRRAMPMNAPQSLANVEVFGVTGYVLYLNGLLPEDAVVDASALRALRMPNRDGFTGDARPDVKAPRCMRDCVKGAIVNQAKP